MAGERRRRKRSQPANTGGKVMLVIFSVMFVLSLGIYLNEKIFRLEFIPTSAEIMAVLGGGKKVTVAEGEIAVHYIDVGQGDCELIVAGETRVLFLDVGQIFSGESGCLHQRVLVRNLLSITARKNLSLSRRSFYTSSKTIRGRLLSYLSDQAVLQGSSHFSIPFDRQQLADYLGVDRSALSNELSKLRREGLVRAEKNQFYLLKQEELL